MKKVAFLLIIVLFAAPACAEDAFLDDFNTFAQAVFGIPQIEFQRKMDGLDYYASETFLLYKDDSTIAIFGTDDLEVISASCCALRCVDNPGSMLDQYGRILHAYFMARSRNNGEKVTATTKSGINVVTQISDSTLFVWLVK